MDLTLRDIDRGNPLDVAGHARRMGLEAPPFLSDGLPVVHLDSLVSEARPLWKAYLETGELFSLAEKFWLAKHGRKDEAGNPIHTIWGEAEAPRREIHQRQGMKIHPLRAAVELDDKFLDVALTVREDVNGKLFYDLGAIDFEKKKSPDGQSARPDKTDGDRGGESTVTRRSPESGQEGTSGVTEFTDAANVTTPGDAVNLEVRDITPDWTPEPPLPVEQAALEQNKKDLEALGMESAFYEKAGQFLPCLFK